MEFEFSFEREVRPEDLLRLYRQAGWSKERTLDGARKVLDGSPIVLGVWQGDNLIGFARAIGDGVYKAMIDDVIVDESFRGKGIGSEMIRRLLEKLRDVEVVFLPCGEKNVPFYERLGFGKMGTNFMRYMKPQTEEG